MRSARSAGAGPTGSVAGGAGPVGAGAATTAGTTVGREGARVVASVIVVRLGTVGVAGPAGL